ncbi:Plasmodium exported protein, unknown function [Plasmodium gallinaceum]|uniref:Uncharacterized protein n=1 Tax=Plasmodium gallinaceum TaxID=5849 RepID=A0A1J1GSR7_PLAGA|nr:Plasmodium exported protein, unknown function [Plasmodium gallinaceum]CRG95486.1 Plasmodium exported protein, unknown function [Plasmodium gallinaceum]
MGYINVSITNLPSSLSSINKDVKKNFISSSFNNKRRSENKNHTNIIFSRIFTTLTFSLLCFLLQCMYKADSTENLRPTFNLSYLRKLSENEKENSMGNVEAPTNDQNVDIENFNSEFEDLETKMNNEWRELEGLQRKKEDHISFSSWLTVLLKLEGNDRTLMRRWFEEGNDMHTQCSIYKNTDRIMFETFKIEQREKWFADYQNPDWKQQMEEEWKKVKEKKMENIGIWENQLKSKWNEWFAANFD